MVIKVKGKRWYPFLLLCILLGTVSFGWKGIVHPWMEAEEKPELLQKSQRVLVFFKTSGARHKAIEHAIKMFPTFLPSESWELTFTEDAGYFGSTLHRDYDSVVFLLTTGDVLDTEQESYFQRFVENGGGFIGIHSATDTEHDWEWYQRLVGARFRDHTSVSKGVFSVMDKDHPAMKSLPRKWDVAEEWFEFDGNPRGEVHVLATVNQGSVVDAIDYGSTDMESLTRHIPKIQERPITWCHTKLGGRSFYTGLGHSKDIYEDPLFQSMIKNALLWTGGILEGDCSAGIDGSYLRETIIEGIESAMEIDVSSAGDIFFIEKSGSVNFIRHEDKQHYRLGALDVYSKGIRSEFGLLGLALDPKYESNRWIYLYYSHPTEPNEVLSRFTIDKHQLDLASEKVLIKIPSERTVCCHVAGSIEFDSEGNLYLAIGDYTNFDISDGYSPQYEGEVGQTADARRTAGNTNDLRGKILRITPQTDGSYTIPSGNLFPGSSEARPEIFVMGVRNPFRISLDQENQLLYWGDVGPDAWSSSTRGPEGFDEINYASKAGNYGWPFCIGNNKPYKKPPPIDFGDSREWYDCIGLVNFSHRNTGKKILPPAQEALIWYPYLQSPIFSGIVGQGKRAVMAGPVYYSNRNKEFPRYYDGDLFIYDWARSEINVVKMADNWEIINIHRFLPKETFMHPIDMIFDQDGSLLILEYGMMGGLNGRITRVRYLGDH